MQDLISPWIILVPVGAWVIWAVDHFWPRTPEQQYGRLMDDLRRDMKRRGLTSEEQEDELRVRRALSDLRHDASAAVARQPQNYTGILEDLTAKQARCLALTSPRACAWFLRLAKTSRADQILLPDAWAKLNGHLKSGRAITPPAPKPTERDLDALRLHLWKR